MKLFVFLNRYDITSSDTKVKLRESARLEYHVKMRGSRVKPLWYFLYKINISNLLNVISVL